MVELENAVHVLPEDEAGGRFFHQLDGDCLCAPAMEQHEVPLYAHSALSEQHHRRQLLRVWNLRRELRGKHAARWHLR